MATIQKALAGIDAALRRRERSDPYTGGIIIDDPKVMWDTDGIRVFTVDDSWV